MFRERDEGLADIRVAAEPLGPLHEPQVELVLERADVRSQLRVETVRVADEIAWVDLEKPREQHARLVGHVRAGAALDLGKVGLADRVVQLALERAGHLGLGHRALEPTQRPLDQPEVAELLAKCHSNSLFDYCVLLLPCQEFLFPFKSMVSATWRSPCSL